MATQGHVTSSSLFDPKFDCLSNKYDTFTWLNASLHDTQKWMSLSKFVLLSIESSNKSQSVTSERKILYDLSSSILALDTTSASLWHLEAILITLNFKLGE